MKKFLMLSLFFNLWAFGMDGNSIQESKSFVSQPSSVHEAPEETAIDIEILSAELSDLNPRLDQLRPMLERLFPAEMSELYGAAGMLFLALCLYSFI